MVKDDMTYVYLLLLIALAINTGLVLTVYLLYVALYVSYGALDIMRMAFRYYFVPDESN